jgi:hypothetical protein
MADYGMSLITAHDQEACEADTGLALEISLLETKNTTGDEKVEDRSVSIVLSVNMRLHRMKCERALL